MILKNSPILLLPLFFLFTSCTTMSAVSRSANGSCQEEVMQLLSKPFSDSSESKRLEKEKFWQLLQTSEAGKKLWPFQAQSLCDFMDFRKNPEKFCENFSADSLNTCFIGYVGKKLETKQADTSLLALSSAAHVTWYMKLRKTNSNKNTGLFWPKALSDYSLYILENMDGRVRYADLLGAEANSPEGKWLVDFDEREAKRIQKKFLKIINKMLTQMKNSPNKEPEDEAEIRELQTRAMALERFRIPKSTKPSD